MLLIINCIVIISINNNCFIILPRWAKTDVCDTCTRLQTEIRLPSHADDPVLVASLQLQLEKHQDEADVQKAMLKQAEADGPTRKPHNSDWRTICTGK